jgi:cytochrome c biogenesis protein
MDAYFVVLRDQGTGQEQAFRAPAAQDVNWQGAGVSFRIAELKTDPDGFVEQARISFSAGNADEPELFWMQNNATVSVKTDRGVFTFSFRQLQSVLFLVTKDPGVWIVYGGFIIMVFGLAISFFLSHRKIWVYLSPADKSGCRILVSGSANKHKPAFSTQFEKLVSQIEADADLTTGKRNK